MNSSVSVMRDILTPGRYGQEKLEDLGWSPLRYLRPNVLLYLTQRLQARIAQGPPKQESIMAVSYMISGNLEVTSWLIVHLGRRSQTRSCIIDPFSWKTGFLSVHRGVTIHCKALSGMRRLHFHPIISYNYLTWCLWAFDHCSIWACYYSYTAPQQRDFCETSSRYSTSLAFDGCLDPMINNVHICNH